MSSPSSFVTSSQSTPPASAIILAGGKSRRMGSDKATLTLPPSFHISASLELLHSATSPASPGVTFVEYLAALCANYCDDVVIVTRDSTQVTQLLALPLLSRLVSMQSHTLRVIPDRVPDSGPLMGLYTGLSASKHAHALVTAVDMPLLQPELLSWLLGLPRDERILLPVVEDSPQVLLALYPHSILPIVEQRLRDGRRDPRSLLDVAPVRSLEETQLRAIDPQLRSFVNVNMPGDYEML